MLNYNVSLDAANVLSISEANAGDNSQLTMALASGTYTFAEANSAIRFNAATGQNANRITNNSTNITVASSNVSRVVLNLGTGRDALTLGNFDSTIRPLDVTDGGLPGDQVTVAAGGAGIQVPSGDVSLKGFETITVNNNVSPSGNLTLAADNLNLAATVGNAYGITTLQPATANRPITVGTRPGNSLGLTQPDLAKVNAETLRLGNPATYTGDVQVTAHVTFQTQNVINVSLQTRGAVTEPGTGFLETCNLNAQGGAGVSLPNGNVIFGDLAGGTTNANAAFNVATSLGAGYLPTVGTVDGVSGVRTAGGDVTLGAEHLALNAPVNAGAGAVQLQPFTASRAIALGTRSDYYGGSLGLGQADLNQVTAGVLRIGNHAADTGAIQVTAAITAPAGWNTLSLQTKGTVTESDVPLTVTNLAAQGDGGVTLTAANAVS